MIELGSGDGRTEGEAEEETAEGIVADEEATAEGDGSTTGSGATSDCEGTGINDDSTAEGSSIGADDWTAAEEGMVTEAGAGTSIWGGEETTADGPVGDETSAAGAEAGATSADGTDAETGAACDGAGGWEISGAGATIG